jgi:hypothetical protein
MWSVSNNYAYGLSPAGYAETRRKKAFSAIICAICGKKFLQRKLFTQL